MRIATLSVLTILCLALSAPAFADINLYTNGPTNGNSDGYFIDVYAVSDSFTVTSRSSMDDFTIALWAPIGATPTGVNWSVGTSSFGNDVGGNLGTHVSWSSLSLLPCPPNCGGGFGYNVWDATITGLPDFLLAPGTTYYLSLTGATDSLGGRDAWDINSGPSLAYHNSLGAVPSESFTITGTTVGGTTPEPSSIMLFGSGILGLAGVLRRKLTR